MIVDALTGHDLLNRNAYGRRRYAVRHHHKRAWSLFNPHGHVEVSPHMLRAGSHSHAAVIMGSCVKHVIGLVVGNSYQRVIFRALKFVPLRASLRQSIELRAPDFVRRTTRKLVTLNVRDRRRPGTMVGSRRRVNLRWVATRDGWREPAR